MEQDGSAAQPWAALRRFTRPHAEVERCELCSEQLPAEHPHLVEPATRRILCACEACGVLFSGEAQTRYQRIPRDVRSLPGFELTDVRWAALQIPIDLAFFFHSTPQERVVAIYPSPAGPTESLIDREAWEPIAQDAPALQRMQPDVEALLVNRLSRPHRCYLSPIDRCYELVGLIRTRWQGLTGGVELWREVDRFFQRLGERARPAREQRHA